MTTTDQPDQPARVEHRMEHTSQLAATPEQVWAAIATADGIATWMAPTQLDPRIGGEVAFDFGDLQSTGIVTDYSPHHRFAYEEPWPIAEREDEVPSTMVEWLAAQGVTMAQVYRDLASVSPIATEFLIESASGGSCVLRVVSSSFGTGADWEHEFFTEMVAGWRDLLDNLVTQLGGAV